MLEILGLAPDEYDLYRVLVETASATPAQLAAMVGTDVDDVVAYLASLEQRGLVGHHVSDGVDHFTASPPTVAIGSLIIERQRWLRRAEIELERLNQLYRKAADERTASDLVDLVPGRQAGLQRVAQLVRASRREVRLTLRTTKLTSPEHDFVEERRALERGVRFRILAERGVLDRPNVLSDFQDGQGIDVRLAAALPSRLLVVDSEVAMVPVMASPDDLTGGALIVHRSGLLDSLVALFEGLWADGAPLLESAPDTDDELDGTDARILRLLNAGLTDHKVSNQLGLSARTVQRRMSRLMARAGVETRLQLGVAAKQRGWL
ncbi:helix-turn-helix transcriptional regulator [Mumia zhuanghuii]|uniref:Transcriptional regulator TrmB n=1 Tax=Mumia zhuanghuii TaxID=2585211 RepID=A0A5C4MLJ0_9ACTN|nr:LuxR family transcriptional regulator [Mumia zhuanghuii]TNC38649.1 transcriptional regulator TrmB [Mumia zhuanghuii]TNC43259.1 transcriptional regulator TrmB [Mumia zhuanghuii]